MTKLHLSKENLKFSSAHFLIFNDQEAEMLHGHNYQVSAEMKGAEADLKKSGFLVNFTDLKKIIKAQVDLWDEHILLPALHPDFTFERKKDFQQNSLHVKFRNRYYVFPQEEVVLLPINNTSVELLSAQLANELFSKLKPLGITGLKIKVEETRGQGAESSIGELS